MKHQVQPTHNSCISTCIAMVAGLPAQVAYDHYHDKLWAKEISIERILCQLGVDYIRTFYDGGTVYADRVYIVVVPSLNCPGEFHQVVMDTRGGEIKVLDPCQGLDGRKYYAWQPEKGEDDMAVPLTSWLNEYEVTPIEQDSE